MYGELQRNYVTAIVCRKVQFIWLHVLFAPPKDPYPINAFALMHRLFSYDIIMLISIL